MNYNDPKNSLAKVVPPGHIIGQVELLTYLVQKKTSLDIEDDDLPDTFDFYIVHNRRDSLFYAEDLASSLRSCGYICFLDEWNWYGPKVRDQNTSLGNDLKSRLLARISRAKACILILGHWTFDSEWVLWEIEKILELRNIPLSVLTIHHLPESGYKKLTELVQRVDPFINLKSAEILEDFSEYVLCLMSEEEATEVAGLVQKLPNVHPDLIKDLRSIWVERVSGSTIERLLDLHDPRRPVFHKIAAGVALAIASVFCLVRGSAGLLWVTGGCVLCLIACSVLLQGIRGRRHGGRMM